VTPDVTRIVYKIEMKRVINRSLVMGVGDGVLEIDGKPIYWAEDLRVGLMKPETLG
jgi:3-hydroxyacyl-[acyl-carrier protein] dehydratase/trans-2-decenoyl-[acyl-carrier protein] isomerase